MQVDVTGRFFHTENETYISLPLVNKAVNRGAPRQPLCTEMLHWDDVKRDRNINDGKPTMQQLFGSGDEDVPLRTFAMGADTYVSQVAGVSAAQAGSPSQSFSAEMLHWDDYCAQRGIATGAPTMSSLFRPFEPKEFVVLDVKEQKLKVHTGNSVALLAYGDSRQLYCSEMEHWDDFVRTKTGQTANPSMASLFRN